MKRYAKLTLAAMGICALALVSGCPGDDCGNGTIDEGETCDDGNTDDGDGCDSICQDENVAMCGNNIVEPPEECDPPSAGFCRGDCTFIPPAPECGNMMIEGTETCDDGNLISGDGCSAMCQLEVDANIGAPCTAAADCGVGGSGLTPVCFTEGQGFPAGYCTAQSCDTMVAPCPPSIDPMTGQMVTSTCASFMGTPSCFRDCTPAAGGNGGCRSDVSGAMNEVAYSCMNDFFDGDAGICFIGCATDDACIAEATCVTPENICVRNTPTPGGTCAASMTCADSPATICTGPADCTDPCEGACAGDAATTCTADGDCAPLCEGACADDGSVVCTADGDCAAICDTSAGSCNSTGTACTVSGDCTDTCGVTTANLCDGDGTTVCATDADCQICDGVCADNGAVACTDTDASGCAATCDFTAGTCADAPGTACTDSTPCTATCDFTSGLCPDGSTACTMADDPACPGTCTAGGLVCDNNGRTCTTDPDCDVRIGDPCTADGDCPLYASCFGDSGDSAFFQDSFVDGFCTILGCGNYPGLPEFTCPAGSFCPAATGFNGGTLNYCAPTCTVDSADAFTECGTIRGDMSTSYACHEQMPDMSSAGIGNFYDTDAAAGFCHPCDNFWAGWEMDCP